MILKADLKAERKIFFKYYKLIISQGKNDLNDLNIIINRNRTLSLIVTFSFTKRVFNYMIKHQFF